MLSREMALELAEPVVALTPGVEEEIRHDAVVGFLESIDPTALEALALGRLQGLEGDGCTTTGEAFLAALLELAQL